MSMSDKVSVVIPTYGRGASVLETIRHLPALPDPPGEILVVDQTEEHPPEILEVFQGLETDDAGFSKDWKNSTEKFQGLEKGIVRRICLDQPSIPHAMNVGLKEARPRIWIKGGPL